MWRNSRDFAEIPTKKRLMHVANKTVVSPPPILHSPPFPLNNEGWLVLIVMQAMNSLASFQVARAYSVRDLNLGGTFRLDAPNTEYFVLSADFLFGMSCRFGYGTMRVVCEPLHQSDYCSDSGTLAMMCYVRMRWPLTSVMCLDIRLHFSA